MRYWPWLLVVAAWCVMLLATGTHQTYLINHAYLLEHSGLPWMAALVMFLCLWQVMTLAMMVPSSLPILSSATHFIGRRRWSTEAVFLAGYASVWTAFAAVAFASDTLIHWLVDHGTWLSAHTSVIGATTFALAGAFQLSPLKRAALAACHRPLGDATGDACLEKSASWHLGVRHGWCCLRSGWALMLMMFGMGMGSLGWMVVLAGLMVVEKNWPVGRWLLPATGIILLLLALMWLRHPTWLSLAQS